MKPIKKTLLLSAGAAALSFSALSGLTAIHAASSDPADGPMSSLISALATKFNLNESDVKEVFDEQRAEMEENREKNREERLAQAVTDGKLTEEQKELLLAKQKEEKALMESLKDKTKEERRAAMDEHRKSMQSWGEEHGIPEEFLRPGPGGHGSPDGGGRALSADR